MVTKRFFSSVLLVILLAGVGCTAGCTATSSRIVKIAFIGPLSGPNQAVGVGARNSFELKVNEVLADEKFPYQVDVVYLDDVSDVEKGISAAQAACADDQIVAAATHWNSPVGLATVSVFHDCNLMQVFWGTVHRDIIYGNDYITKVRVIPTSVQFNEMGAEWAVGQFKRLRWAIVYDNTEYGTTLSDEFEQSLEWRGGSVLGRYMIEVGQEDFAQVLADIAKLPVDGIFFGGLVTEGGKLRKQMVESGLGNIMFIGAAGIQSQTFSEIAGETAEGSFCAGTFDPTKTAEGIKFIQDYEAQYEEPYEQNGPYAYDSAGIIMEAIREAGPSRQSIIKYIRSHDFTGITGTIHWDAYGQNTSGGISLYINQDGMWVRYEDSEYATGVRTLPWEDK